MRNLCKRIFNRSTLNFVLLWRSDPTRAMASSFLMFLDHTQRRTTVGRTPLDEWSARRRDLYLTTHNNHNRQTSMPTVGFEPTISAGERPQTYALDRAATGTGIYIVIRPQYIDKYVNIKSKGILVKIMEALIRNYFCFDFFYKFCLKHFSF